MFHPDKSYANPELGEIQTNLFLAFQQLSEESQDSMKGKLELLEVFLPINEVRTHKIEPTSNRPLAALEGTVKDNAEPAHLEKAETKVGADKYFHWQAATATLRTAKSLYSGFLRLLGM